MFVKKDFSVDYPLHLYGYKDVVKNRFFNVFSSETDGSAVRDTYLSVSIYPNRNDIKLYDLGGFDDVSGKFLALREPREVDVTAAYEFCEAQLRAYAPGDPSARPYMADVDNVASNEAPRSAERDPLVS